MSHAELEVCTLSWFSDAASFWVVSITLPSADCRAATAACTIQQHTQSGKHKGTCNGDNFSCYLHKQIAGQLKHEGDVMSDARQPRQLYQQRHRSMWHVL